jgi:hypothetical protein
MPSASSTEDTARRLAGTHHGVVTRRLLRDAGCPDRHVRFLFDHPRWVAVSDHVLRLDGTPRTVEQELSIAVLDAGPGAHLSHMTAANRYGNTGCRLRPISVVRLSSTTRSTRFATVHRVRDLPTPWLTELDGIPIVRPELLALQLFATCRYERAERLVERMWSSRLLSGRSLRALLDLHGKRGRDGTAGLRRYLELRGNSYTPSATGLETRTLQILRDAGMEFRPQVDSGGATWTGRVDFRHVVRPMILEVQSERFHSALVDRLADRRRMEHLRRDGFEVLEVTDALVWSDPAALVRQVRAALDRSVPSRCR